MHMIPVSHEFPAVNWTTAPDLPVILWVAYVQTTEAILKKRKEQAGG